MSTPTLGQALGGPRRRRADRRAHDHDHAAVRRFNPEVSADAEWVDYQLPIDPKERVLDALHKVKWEIDGSLTFRRSCAPRHLRQ